jgi:hypothetical protein
MANATKSQIAELKKRIEELEKAKPEPEVSREERERRARAWQDEMHQMREGRMAQATPPSVVRDFAVLDDRMVKEIALRDARAPTSPSSAIPGSRQSSNVSPGGGGTGWAREIPLGPSPHQRYVDAQLDAQDAKDRAEREAQFRALAKLTEQKP